MNKNALAKEVTKREGKKKSLSIAQVKEVIRILDDIKKEEEVVCRTFPLPIKATHTTNTNDFYTEPLDDYFAKDRSLPPQRLEWSWSTVFLVIGAIVFGFCLGFVTRKFL